MKTNYIKIFGVLSLAAITTLGVVSCKDEVLVPVKDNTTADSLVNLITKLDAQKITLDKKLNTITITNAILNDSSNSLGNSVNEQKTVEYTVNLINAGTTVTGRTKGVDGVSVVVTQNGKSTTVTSADGRAIFTGLIQGAADVSVSAAGFAGVNATVYLGADNTGSWGDGAVRSVTTNLLLIPIGGADGITISGKLYINRSVLDDTIGRQFTKPGDAKESKYISAPSNYDGYNWTSYDYGNLQNIYGYTQGYNNSATKFDALASGSSVYAYPDLSSTYNPSNNATNGYITSISYSGLISYATADVNGAYTINVAYVLNGAADDEIGYYIYADPIDANLTRFDDQSASDGSVQGTPGSVKTTFKSFNTSTYVTTTGIERFVISDSFRYYASISLTGGMTDPRYGMWYGGSYNSNYLDGQYTRPGATINSNIYYFPLEKN